jgi:hypothetical protein
LLTPLRDLDGAGSILLVVQRRRLDWMEAEWWPGGFEGFRRCGFREKEAEAEGERAGTWNGKWGRVATRHPRLRNDTIYLFWFWKLNVILIIDIIKFLFCYDYDLIPHKIRLKYYLLFYISKLIF